MVNAPVVGIGRTGTVGLSAKTGSTMHAKRMGNQIANRFMGRSPKDDKANSVYQP